jgi:hypothetical protein
MKTLNLFGLGLLGLLLYPLAATADVTWQKSCQAGSYQCPAGRVCLLESYR